MIIFLTVLKSRKPQYSSLNMDIGYSGYTPEHIYSLKNQIERNCTVEHEFYCLTDLDDMECNTITLTMDLPGWWSKMELFRPDIYEGFKDDTIIYFDIDTVIRRNIDKLANYPHKFSALADKSANPIVQNRMWSGIMAWSGDYTHVYKKFSEYPDFNMQRSKLAGDQQFIHELVGEFTSIEDIFPECMCFNNLKPEDDPSILYFYGDKKPWDIDHPLITPSLYNR